MKALAGPKPLLEMGKCCLPLDVGIAETGQLVSRSDNHERFFIEGGVERLKNIEVSVEKAKAAVSMDVSDGVSWCKSVVCHAAYLVM